MKHQPEEIIKDAHDAINGLFDVMLKAAPAVAPDFAMRTAIAAREALTRHQPSAAFEPDCQFCTMTWPCPDVNGYLSILGVVTEEMD